MSFPVRCKMAVPVSPGRDVFAEGLLELLKPAVQQLDSHVHAVRESQVDLREHIDSLASGRPDNGGDLIPHSPRSIRAVESVQKSSDSSASETPTPELCKINEDQKVALDLDPYVKKLLNARRRVVLVNNILQNAQERLRRLNHSVAKETARRRAMLESGAHHSPTSPNK